jgi:ATP-dependent DNA ligase
MLHQDHTIPVMFIAFDPLAEHGLSLVDRTYRERRRRLEPLDLAGPA